MGKFNIITISRQYGSGGHFIGEKLAKELGLPCYDKLLIEMIASKSGMDKSYLDEDFENMTASRPFNIPAVGYYPVNTAANIVSVVGEDVFEAQSEVIEGISEKPCIIIGRCADYILRDRDDVLKVFIKASYEQRIRRAIDEYGVDPAEVHKIIKKSDKGRAKHYGYYCEQKWGRSENYDIIIDTSIGIQKTVDIVLTAFR